MPIPKDIKLYNKTKKNIYKKHPKHSEYRRDILVKTYKKNYIKKHGKKKNTYIETTSVKKE